MLREVGNGDPEAPKGSPEHMFPATPRVMRHALERLPESQRQLCVKGF
jgi:hypothetical protein